MSPTRRDILKTIAIAPVALTASQGVAAAQAADDMDKAIDRHRASFKALSDRIVAEHDEIEARCVRFGEEHGVWLEYEGNGQYIARQPDRPGECELVEAHDCTCRRFRVWRRCEHTAMVRELERQERE